jgi:hypothetical protein
MMTKNIRQAINKINYQIKSKEYSFIKFCFSGELTNLRQSLVNNKFFSHLAVKYQFNKYLNYENREIFNKISYYSSTDAIESRDRSYLSNENNNNNNNINNFNYNDLNKNENEHNENQVIFNLKSN